MISTRDLSPPRLLVIADVLGKNVALSHDEREVAKVIEVVEPVLRVRPHRLDAADRPHVVERALDGPPIDSPIPDSPIPR